VTGIDYAKAQALYRKHKAALTRAKKKGPREVIAACDLFAAEFHQAGLPLPDDWHRWESAKRDAQLEQMRNC
jgi:hypothetical protein